jgi:hypothetical protein
MARVKREAERPANIGRPPPAGLDAKAIGSLSGLYTTWLKVGQSDLTVGIISSLAMADLLHSAGLLKDSMYSRIGTFLSVDFITGQAANIIGAGTTMRSLVEGTPLSVENEDVERRKEGSGGGYTEAEVQQGMKMISQILGSEAAAGLLA